MVKSRRQSSKSLESPMLAKKHKVNEVIRQIATEISIKYKECAVFVTVFSKNIWLIAQLINGAKMLMGSCVCLISYHFT